MILCGGYAKRLWPVTFYRAKALLPIARKPILTYILRAIETVPEIDEIIISTNARFRSDFETWLKKARPTKPVRLVVEPTMAEEEKFGAVRGIAHAIEAARIRDDLMIIAGDNLFDFDLNELVAFYRSRLKPVIAVYDVRSRERARLYGVVRLAPGGRVIEFLEKPDQPPSTLISTAIYVLPKACLGMFREYLATGGPADAPGWFLQWLVNRVDVHAWPVRGHWFDIGDRASLAAARRWAKKK